MKSAQTISPRQNPQDGSDTEQILISLYPKPFIFLGLDVQDTPMTATTVYQILKSKNDNVETANFTQRRLG